MTIIKKCFDPYCNEFFEGELNEISRENLYCKKHQSEWEGFVIRAKDSRNIEVEAYDVYDDSLPICKNGSYQRVCRICGATLLTKAGKYSHNKRYCGSKECNYYKHPCINWGTLRQHYYYSMVRSLVITRGIYNAYDGPHKFRRKKKIPLCELCGKITEVIEIHHKIPVHCLNETNFQLIWDRSNLIGLCKDCHKNQDHFLKQYGPNLPTKQDKKLINFKRIDSWL